MLLIRDSSRWMPHVIETMDDVQYERPASESTSLQVEQNVLHLLNQLYILIKGVIPQKQ